ncbi:hypothetical protein NBRC116585_23900 [Thalassolituus maritimus]|uniref:Uncharacterized protein n=1 Tax=Thalassolituus maritimus TaxID=484498 RepID=A0ABQ0A1S1_9GAMM
MGHVYWLNEDYPVHGIQRSKATRSLVMSKPLENGPSKKPYKESGKGRNNNPAKHKKQEKSA